VGDIITLYSFMELTSCLYYNLLSIIIQSTERHCSPSHQRPLLLLGLISDAPRYIYYHLLICFARIDFSDKYHLEGEA
jgi:hypothetical protein